MASSRPDGAGERAKLFAGLIKAAIAALIVSAPATAAATSAADGPLSESDKTCLGCHAQEGLNKELPTGKTLSLRVRADAFAKSVHAPLGCAACHADIKPEVHSQAQKSIKTTRDYSIAMAEVCRGCHDEAFTQHQGSIHAMLLQAGNLTAPVCTDCHGSHTVSPKTAYETCVACHVGASGTHGKWLPNAALHLEVVSCAACHAPTSARLVDLRLYDGAAQKWIVEKDGAAMFEKLARAVDKNGNGLDASELRDVLAEINRGPMGPTAALRGRIELRTAAEAHRLSAKANAISDCNSCHSDGAEPFQSVTISSTGPDGRPIRYRAQTEVLSSVLSTDSLRLFYAIGGTRNQVLDILLILALLAGISVPVGHQIMKRLVTKQAESDASKDASTDRAERVDTH